MVDRLTNPYLQNCISGRTVGVVSGTAYRLPSVDCNRVILRPLTGNTASVFVGNTTGVFKTTDGYEIATSDDNLVLEGLGNLSLLQLAVISPSDGVSWLCLFDVNSYPLG